MTCLSCLEREDRDVASGCGCDHGGGGACVAAAPGLAQLPVTVPAFPEIREALLSAAGGNTSLAGWTARAEDDLGVMLLESWAYVLDVVHFYNRRHAARGYLRTAPDAGSLGRLAALVGYRPRQATAAQVTVAAIAGAKGAAQIPAGLQVRSQGVPGVPPQVFEVAAAATADPRTNFWDVAPIRPDTFSGLVAFAPGAAGVPVGAVVLFTGSGSTRVAARVTAFAGRAMPDGADYRVATLAPEPAALVGQPLAGISVAAMAQAAGPTSFPTAVGTFTATASSSRTEWVLDGVYPQLAAGDRVVVETVGGTLMAQTLSGAVLTEIELGRSGASVAGKATKVTLGSAAELRRLHFRAVPAGALINPAQTSIAASDLAPTTLALAPPVGASGDAALPQAFIATGRGEGGARLVGALHPGAHGTAEVETTALADATAASFAAPVRLHGNLVELSRGQTVDNEVLGSADASKPFQRFRLAKKPLTYFPDPARPGAIRPELEVRVNGVLWQRVESFLSAPEGAQVYVVRHDSAGETDIVFGTRHRPPSGVRNVTARYRSGAGALSPPPGTITQVVGKVPNLSRIVAPLAVRGGSDAEGPETIRTAVPRSALAQGRAVSIADYAVIASGYPGVIASAVDWAWAPGAQRAGVAAWIVCEGGDVSSKLAAAMRRAGHPDTIVTVTAASQEPVALGVDILADPAFVASEVCAAVQSALADPVTGLLAVRNLPIAGAVFRSAIARAVMHVPGVAAVRAILANGSDMPAALAAPAGHYLGFTVSVGGN